MIPGTRVDYNILLYTPISLPLARRWAPDNNLVRLLRAQTADNRVHAHTRTITHVWVIFTYSYTRTRVRASTYNEATTRVIIIIIIGGGGETAISTRIGQWTWRVFGGRGRRRHLVTIQYRLGGVRRCRHSHCSASVARARVQIFLFFFFRRTPLIFSIPRPPRDQRPRRTRAIPNTHNSTVDDYIHIFIGMHERSPLYSFSFRVQRTRVRGV